MFQITLEAARVNARLSQKIAAKSLGISTTTLGNYEKGKTSPSVPMFEKMCALYGVPCDCVKILADNPHKADNEVNADADC